MPDTEPAADPAAGMDAGPCQECGATVEACTERVSDDRVQCCPECSHPMGATHAEGVPPGYHGPASPL